MTQCRHCGRAGMNTVVSCCGLPVPAPTALHSTWRLACCRAPSLPHLHAAEVERVLDELPRGGRQPEQHLDALDAAPAPQPRHRRQRAHQVTVAACAKAKMKEPRVLYSMAQDPDSLKVAPATRRRAHQVAVAACQGKGHAENLETYSCLGAYNIKTSEHANSSCRLPVN